MRCDNHQATIALRPEVDTPALADRFYGARFGSWSVTAILDEATRSEEAVVVAIHTGHRAN